MKVQKIHVVSGDYKSIRKLQVDSEESSNHITTYYSIKPDDI